MVEKLPLVVSMGEPAGIGPEIILKAYLQAVDEGLPFFYVYGDAALLRISAEQLGLDISVIDIKSAEEAAATFASGLPVISVADYIPVQPGDLSASSSRVVIEAIRRAVEDIYAGSARGLVTAPIHKANLYAAGFNFPGHTEFLSELTAEFYGVRRQPVMMLASDDLKVVPVTIHIPFSKVPEALSCDLIIETVRIVHQDLVQRFGIERPRIMLTGLNPHAGEDGKIGREEIEIILPAIETLKNEGIDVFGPQPADVSFHQAARARYDVAVAMYHDQALIPIKTLAFDEGVNITLGLPFVRTSPDHGTALDIAGQGIASPKSLFAAMRMADTLATNSGGADVS